MGYAHLFMNFIEKNKPGRRHFETLSYPPKQGRQYEFEGQGVNALVGGGGVSVQ